MVSLPARFTHKRVNLAGGDDAKTKNELIGELTVKDGVVMADSRSVAARFEKRHDNVRKAIQELDCSPEFLSLNFEEKSEASNGGRPAQVFYMTRDGFSFLVMGFTGKEAALWKETYIGAFNAMEAQLRSQGAPQVKPLDEKELRLQQKHWLWMAKQAGLTGNQAVFAADRAVNRVMGFPTLEAMGVTDMPAASDDAPLNVTEIGKRMEILKKGRINVLLTQYGYQTAHRGSKNQLYYELTSKGKAAGGELQDTGKAHGGGAPVFRVMWRSSVIPKLQADIDADVAAALE